MEYETLLELIDQCTCAVVEELPPKEHALGHTAFPAKHHQVSVTSFLKIPSCSWATAQQPDRREHPLMFSLFLICFLFCQQTNTVFKKIKVSTIYIEQKNGNLLLFFKKECAKMNYMVRIRYLRNIDK